MVLNPDDPPDEVPALHWHDREPCPFSREECEVYGTYVSRAEPPQEQHGGGGRHGAVQAPGRDRFASGLHAWFASDLHQIWQIRICIDPNFMLGLDFCPNFMLGLDCLHDVCRWFAFLERWDCLGPKHANLV